MQIIFHDAENTTKEPEFAAAVMRRAARFADTADTIDIYTAPRVPLDAADYKHPGSIEWGINVKFTSGGGIFIGALQRSPEADAEFHS